MGDLRISTGVLFGRYDISPLVHVHGTASQSFLSALEVFRGSVLFVLLPVNWVRAYNPAGQNRVD